MHFDANQQIKQIRVYWDQASLLKQVEVIGARGRQWPIRDGKDQTRLLRTAVAVCASPSQPASQQTTDLPHRPSSPGKRRIKDPYGAGSLTELLSPSKEMAELESRAEPPRPASSSKRYTQDPYGAGSLTEILSPTKQPPAHVAPFAPASGRPAARHFSDIFVKDDDLPDSPSKPQRRTPRVQEGDEKADKGPVDEDRHFYKSVPGKYNHFELGGDNSEREIKGEGRHSNHYNTSHWEFNDFATPVKNSRPQRGNEVRHFGFGDEQNDGSPPSKLNVIKPRRDANRHFDVAEEDEEDDGRIIGSFGGRGQRLYENRLFDDNGQPQLSEREQKDEPLAVTGNAVNRNKNFVSQFELVDESPASKDTKPAQKHDKAVKMMESHWDNYDELSPEPRRNATMQRNPLTHNQPSWHHGDE